MNRRNRSNSTAIHPSPHPLAGKTVKIKKHIIHPQVPMFGGSDFIIEDWHDRLMGKSWMFCEGNPACLVYAVRTGFSKNPVPNDNEVLYGKVGAFGHLVHICELDIVQAN